MIVITCCDQMAFHCSQKEEIIAYESHLRLYGIRVTNRRYGVIQKISYCPWCLSKLPKSLEEEHASAVKDACGLVIDPQTFMHDTRVPSEFKIDQWWRDRGL